MTIPAGMLAVRQSGGEKLEEKMSIYLIVTLNVDGIDL